jgi:hypothetical protein
VRQLTQAEKRRVTVRGGQTGTDVAPVTDAEYPELLTAVYKRADITKPRNLVGLAKDLPVQGNGKPAARQRAGRRGVDAPTGRGARRHGARLPAGAEAPSERLFLGAVRTTASGSDWKPGAELKLTMK